MKHTLIRCGNVWSGLVWSGLVLSSTFVACEKPNNNPNPELPPVGDESTLLLSVDKTTILANGEDAATFTVELVAKDNTKTDVTQKAVIKGNGTAVSGNTFTATTAGKWGFSAEYDGKTSNTVNVTANDAAKRIVLSHDKTTRVRGAQFSIKAVIMPGGTTDGITWTSSKTNIASVGGGVFTALASGASTLTASAPGAESATCELTVENTCGTTDNIAGGVGTASFKTDKTWIVGNQEWSDEVQTSTCMAKTTYLGGANNSRNYNSDCRNNPGYGDLFSWCAAIKYQDVLCPEGWRLPTLNEFIYLDIELGFSGGFSEVSRQQLDDTYLSPTVWGGTLSGNCSGSTGFVPAGTLGSQGMSVSYWASDEYTTGNGYCTYVSTYEDAYSKPLIQADAFMSLYDNGQSLRCIKTI